TPEAPISPARMSRLVKAMLLLPLTSSTWCGSRALDPADGRCGHSRQQRRRRTDVQFPNFFDTCSAVKHSSKTKSKRRSKTLPALGFAGVSLSMASGACAPTGEAMANTSPTSQQSQQIFLGEEEISDVSLATFYVFDKENTGPRQQLRLARCGGGG